ncbi:MAG: twin-arginine translocase subunit TatC [Rickettsiales bacterium]|jgi:sec-independent protein translocase protein TatC|nr:twin-arginine translocase subunit TatC [Rickettsiales bacterium]
MKTKKKEELKELPLAEHFKELRARIINCVAFFAVALVLCYSCRDRVYNIITYPLVEAFKAGRFMPSVIYTRLTEAFTSMLSISLSAALLVSIPFFTIQLWLFITPALYKEERKWLLPYMLLTPILFFAGVLFCYFFVLPPAFEFFITFADGDKLASPLVPQAKISEYIDLAVSLLIAFGVCFLTPVLLALLARIGIVSADALKRGRKYAIVAIFIVAAVLTPPDVASQIMLAVPLLAMYEISILLISRRKI